MLYLKPLEIIVKLGWVWISNLADQFMSYLLWGWWRIEEYTTLKLQIPDYKIAYYERFQEELVIWRPLLTPEGYEKQFHPETCYIASRFPNLRELRIDMCGLLEVPLLPNRWLTRLIITDNPITHLPADLPDTITDLFLIRNDIRELPKRLPKNLRKLDVFGNPNLRLPKNYRFPNRLEELICHTVQIEL